LGAAAPLLSGGHHVAAGLSTATVAVIAAVIGAGGSVVGGIVGGLIAYWTTGISRTGTARTQRSHQSALGIAHGISTLHEAIGAWKAAALAHDDLAASIPADNVQRGPRLSPASQEARRACEAMRAAFHEYSKSATAQSIALTDDDLRARLSSHTELARLLCRVAEQRGTAGPGLADTARPHGAAVLATINAHVNAKPLPVYVPLPSLDVSNAQKLLDWKPFPESPEIYIP